MVDPSVLVLQNPGKVSRHYMTGIASGLRRAGVRVSTLELGPVWAAAQAGGDAARAEARRALLATLQRERVTHAIGYVFNGLTEFGLVAWSGGPGQSILAAAGIRHLMLWTDHPEWASDRAAFQPHARALLKHPMHDIMVKSASARDETAAVFGFENAVATTMGEDYSLLRPVADRGAPVHDIVAIVSNAADPGAIARGFVGDDDPDPREIDLAHREAALAAFGRVVEEQAAMCGRLGADWLDAKIARPFDSFWRIAGSLEGEHGEALAWLRAEPSRWFDAVAALRTMVRWRRNFYLAWLGQRFDVGVYGSPAEPLGFASPDDAPAWIDYDAQSAIYARGRVVYSCNDAHDEEGLTHKPFQIAASATCCVHHDVRGLGDAFTPGEDVVVFDRPRVLGERIRELLEDEQQRTDIGQAMHARGCGDHDWSVRAQAWLSRREVRQSA